MGATRELTRAPSSLGLSLRAAAALVPGASALPFIAGGGREIPGLTLTLHGARVDGARLAAYARVCGYASSATFPATAPHLLAFPLHMALMTDGSFPFPAVGLVHLANRIVLHRAIPAASPLDLSVQATPLEPHPKGRTFTIVSEARIAGELVWEEHSTMLRRGATPAPGSSGGDERDGLAARTQPPPATAAAAEWQLGEDLGRRYAAVSGDRNPIHMHALSARLFGFPRAIAHGMWTKARCLAALEAELPEAYAVDVAFRRPILLPDRVAFTHTREHEQISFVVSEAQEHTTIHLEGTVTP